jgi:hypothetical protein
VTEDRAPVEGDEGDRERRGLGVVVAAVQLHCGFARREVDDHAGDAVVVHDGGEPTVR